MSAELKTARLWVKAKVVATALGVSLTAVYQGQCGMDRIRSARIPGAGKNRQARRWLWSDVEALHKEMLAQTETREDVPARILRLMGRRRIRRG